MLCFNRLDLTKKCVESIFSSADADRAEVIIVDNFSTDGTREWLSECPLPVTAVLCDKNVGIQAYNHAVSIARAPYLVTLNNDVVVTGDWLARMRRKFLDDPKMAQVGCREHPCYLNEAGMGDGTIEDGTPDYIEGAIMMVQHGPCAEARPVRSRVPFRLLRGFGPVAATQETWLPHRARSDARSDAHPQRFDGHSAAGHRRLSRHQPRHAAAQVGNVSQDAQFQGKDFDSPLDGDGRRAAHDSGYQETQGRKRRSGNPCLDGLPGDFQKQSRCGFCGELLSDGNSEHAPFDQS